MNIKKLLAAIPLALMLGLTPPSADAEDNVVLVELFTDQGVGTLIRRR